MDIPLDGVHAVFGDAVRSSRFDVGAREVGGTITQLDGVIACYVATGSL